MTNPIFISDDTTIYAGAPELYIPKNIKHLKKFNKWAKKHKLMPGMIIPKRIFKKHFKRSEDEDID